MIHRAVAGLAAFVLFGCGGPATSVAPSAPSVAPTATTAPPTATSVPPTATSVAPTASPVLEWPEGFSTHYTLSFDMPFENEPYTEGGFTNAFLIRERVTLAGPNGRTAGTGILTAIDYRPGREAVECGGNPYVGELAHDLADPPGGFVGELKDGTQMSLVPDRQVAVYVGNLAPTCFEHYGTYTITFSGEEPSAVKTGRYTWINGKLDFD